MSILQYINKLLSLLYFRGYKKSCIYLSERSSCRAEGIKVRVEIRAGWYNINEAPPYQPIDECAANSYLSALGIFSSAGRESGAI